MGETTHDAIGIKNQGKKIMKVNGHVANDTEGIIFFHDNSFLKLPKKLWEETMQMLHKARRIELNDKVIIYPKI